MTKKISELVSLKGKVSIVTGGAGHLGSSISEALAELGSEVIIIGQQKEKGENFVSHLKKEFNVDSSFHQVDLNSSHSIDSFFDSFEKPVHILVNNAFTWPLVKIIEETSWENFAKTLESGITSPFYVSKIIAEKMKKLGEGSIVNVSSMYGMISPNFKIYRNQPKMGNALGYNAVKAAIIQMTKYQAVHYAKWKIRVNCISPGPFPPPGAFSNGKEWFEDELKSMNPMHKLGEPWHLKGSIALLVSDLGAYITGQNIVIDGGWTIW